MVLKMALEYGGLLKEIFMKEIGFWIDNMEKESISIVLVLIEDSLLIFWRKEMDSNTFQMEINTLVLINKANLMEKEDINGQMAVIMTVPLWMDFVKGKECGYIQMEQFMRDHLKKISKMVSENRFTNLEKDLRDNSKKGQNTMDFTLMLIKRKRRYRISLDFIFKSDELLSFLSFYVLLLFHLHFFFLIFRVYLFFVCLNILGFIHHL